MTERHSIAINIENCRIGCLDCDEWDEFFPRQGFSSNSEIICKLWLEQHLKRMENTK